MGTEKFIAFKEDGSAYRLKGRILRFLDNEPVSEADKTNIRSTLSVPASAEGLTPANNLSDLDNAATARTNLSVNSIDEDAESAGTKLVGPALYFDGVNDYLEVADNVKLSYTDGTDDLPFSISAWVKISDADRFGIVSKWQGNNEFIFYTDSSNKLALLLSDGTNTCNRTADSAFSQTGDWVHVVMTYGGSGPNSATAFTSAADESALYVNGQLIASTAANNASYGGIQDTADALWIGGYSGNYAKGHIKDVKLYNRELTATEVAQLARGTDLGFADEWGGALGGVYTQDSTPSGEWTAVNATDADEAGPIGGKSNVLKITSDNTNNAHYVSVPTGASGGKRYRIEFLYRIPSGQSNVDGIVVDVSAAFGVYTAVAPATDTWLKASFEYVSPGSTMNVFMTDGGNKTFTDSGGDDLLYIAECKITEIGKLADFRAENFDEDTGKIYDVSSNAFVGTSANLPTLTGRAYPVYETGTWTPTITLGGGNTGLTYSVQDGNYTRIGNICYLNGIITLSAKGSSTGQVDLNGFPFTAANTSNSQQSFAVGYASSVTGLTSGITGLIDDSGTEAQLYDWGASGATNIDDTNLTDTSNLRFSIVYQIQ